jgi:transposase-like protein
VDTKVCTKCGIEKPLDMFNKSNHNSSGHSPRCKQCDKEYREENKERAKEYSKLYRKEHEEELRLKKKTYREENILLVLVDKRIKKSKELNLPYSPRKELVEHVQNLYKKQNGKCACCGVEMVVNDEYSKDDSMTIDKLVKEDGYVVDNVNLICFACNTVKNDGNSEDIYQVLNWLTDKLYPKTSG